LQSFPKFGSKNYREKNTHMKKIFFFMLMGMLNLALSAQVITVYNAPLGTTPNILIGGTAASPTRYHVSEAIYTNEEIGNNNFTSVGTAIQKINFFVTAEGAPTTITNYRVSMKNVTSATQFFVAGPASTTGYTIVFDGTFNAVADANGVIELPLTTSFVRTAGSNLQIKFERLDNAGHPGYAFVTSNGNNFNGTGLSTRRYNSNTAPTAATSLSTSAFRPAIQFVHIFDKDAGIFAIIPPTVSCYNSNQSLFVAVSNDGTDPIPAGAANISLSITGANTYSGTTTNTGIIAPGGFEVVVFSGANLNNAGDNFGRAIVNYVGDGTALNDTTFNTFSTANTITSFPVVEDVESTLPVFPYAELLAGADQLWTVQTGKYGNADLDPDSLAPRAPGNRFYLYDSYSGSGSIGFSSRLFSNCITVPSTSTAGSFRVTNVSFWMSHDNKYLDALDSIYLTVSTDRGQTWTRLAGYQRPDATALVPTWRQETVDISVYNGQTIQLGFEAISQYGNAIGLDDINITSNIVLPVTMLNFDARRAGKVNNLTWTTAQEINTRKFDVERSTDGVNFAPIGSVDAVGNSAASNSYRFIDPKPSKGTNYYRLRSIDNDNAFKFSSIKSVKNLGTPELAINPNPVAEIMKIALEAEYAEKANVIITDLSGRRVYNGAAQVIAGSNQISIPVQQLSKGTYLVMIQLNNETLVKKITKL
jgi:hypothetical protein